MRKHSKTRRIKKSLGALKDPKRPPPNAVRPPPAKAPTESGIDGDPTYSENHLLFARRADVENCIVTKYHWGIPGVNCQLLSYSTELHMQSES